jgi:hypothetical protein
LPYRGNKKNYREVSLAVIVLDLEVSAFYNMSFIIYIDFFCFTSVVVLFRDFDSNPGIIQVPH